MTAPTNSSEDELYEKVIQILAKDTIHLPHSKAIGKYAELVMQLIQSERQQAATLARIDELTPIYAEDGGTVWCMSSEGVEVYKKDRLAELKAQLTKPTTNDEGEKS